MNRCEENPDHDLRCILQHISRLDICSFSWFYHLEVDKLDTSLLKYVLMLILCIFFYLADDEAPILNCPNISSTMDEGLNSSSTVLLNSTATDNVDYHLDVICSHSSEGIFLIGDTTLNCSSADAAGNTDTCLLVVTVTGVNMIILLCLKDSDHRSGLRFIGYVIYTLKDESLGICMCSTINNFVGCFASI